jgi:anti-sigma-K factor RskA
MTNVDRAAEDLDLLAGEYVLGTLPLADRQPLEARLDHDPALRAVVAQWQARLLPLTDLAEPVAPSAALWQRIEASIEARAQTPAMARPSTVRPSSSLRRSITERWWNSVEFWRWLTGSGYALASALALALVLQLNAPPAAPQYMVVLVAPQDKAPGWVVQASSRRQIRLIPLAVAPIPADKALEFWTKGDGWTGPVSLGLVRPGEPLQIRLDQLPPLEANQLFELTLEPPTGSPTGKPTGPIQFIGRAVKVL